MKKFLLITFLVILFIGGLLYYQSTKLSVKDCLNLGSNYRTNVCLKEIGYFKPLPTQAPFPVEYLQVLSVENSKYGNSEVRIKNNFSETAKNIVIKITYSNSKNGNIIDTKYESLSQEIKPNDIVTTTIYLKYSDKQYWYQVSPYRASY